MLDDADAARAAFRDWSQADDLFFVDNGLNLFLMLLYERIKHWGETYRDHDRLRGVVRHAWVMHQRFRRDIREIGSTLGSAGIAIMLLKGAALNVNVYPDANRLMSDVDIAVPRSRVAPGDRSAAECRMEGELPQSGPAADGHACLPVLLAATASSIFTGSCSTAVLSIR